jgi:hypothetical protein
MRVRNLGSSPPRQRVEADAMPIDDAMPLNDDTELKLASVVPETLHRDGKPEVLLQVEEQVPRITITDKASEERTNPRYSNIHG